MIGSEEEASGVEGVVTEEFECGAVIAVGSALDGDIGLRAGVHSVLGGIDSALNLELLDGFDGGNEEHGRLEAVGGRNAVESDVLIGVALSVGGEADNLTGHGSGADGLLAVNAHTGGTVDNAGHQRGGLGEVAAVEGQFDDAPVVHDGAESGVLSFEERRGSGDFDAFGLLADL